MSDSNGAFTRALPDQGEVAEELASYETEDLLREDIVPLTITRAEEAAALVSVVERLDENGRVYGPMRPFLNHVQARRRAVHEGDAPARDEAERAVLRTYEMVRRAVSNELKPLPGSFLERIRAKRAAASSSEAPTVAQASAPSPEATPVLASSPLPSEQAAPATFIGTRRPTPSEAEELLQAAPRVFAAALLRTNAAAVVFEYIRKHKLYEAARFKRMPEYAHAHLGLTTDGSYREYARAGVAAWALYPAESSQLLERLLKGGVEFQPPLAAPPRLPGLSVLRELPRALKKTEPAQHHALLTMAAAGEVTLKELRAMKHPAGATAAPASRSHVELVVSEQQAFMPAPVTVPDSPDDAADAEDNEGPRLDVFNEVPDLTTATSLLRQATEILATVTRVCKEGHDHEVDELAANLSPAVVFLEHLVKTLENDLTPASVCSHCEGDGCSKCRDAGWQPKAARRMPLRLEGKLAFTRQKAPAKTRAQGGTSSKASNTKGATKKRK